MATSMKKQHVRNLKLKRDSKCNVVDCTYAIKKPYLACTPDGVISDTTIIENKCLYSGRDIFIKPGK